MIEFLNALRGNEPAAIVLIAFIIALAAVSVTGMKLRDMRKAREADIQVKSNSTSLRVVRDTQEG